MKFSHDFSESLKKEEYPQQWVDSAISYRQLKKCIKRVQRELQALGLDPTTLNNFWQSIDDKAPAVCTESRENNAFPFQYSFPKDTAAFTPKLTFAIDSENGSPVDAWLSHETRVHLQKLSIARRAEGKHESGLPHENGRTSEHDVSHNGIDSDSLDSGKSTDESDPEFKKSRELETVEIPLTSDSEFFQILKRELTSLDALQQREQKRLTEDVVRLGQEIERLSSKTTLSKDKSRSDMYVWREIFRLYIESQVFFSTNERSSGSRSAISAQKHLQTFTDTLAKEKMVRNLKKPGREALEDFLSINISLLQNLKFQDINRTALSKIMKKFDKRTALRAQATVTPTILANEPFMATSVAKAVCFEISESLLNTIPQLSDYLCPICLTISFKPIRLRCNHVFCIRCLVVMQRARQDKCPMCRGGVVMEASSVELDEKLMVFLREKFPAEAKAKQKENERALAVDRYGEDYDKCAVM